MNYEENKADHLIALAMLDYGRSNALLLDSIDDSQITLSSRLKKRILRMESRHSHEKAYKCAKRIGFRVAIAVMLIITMMFVTLLCVTAIREAICGTVIEWYEKYVSIRFENSEPSEHSGEDFDFSAVPTSIESVRKPTYIPDGCTAEIKKEKTATILNYRNTDGDTIADFRQSLLDDRKYYYDSDTAIIEDIFISGYDGKIITYSKDSTVFVIWSDGEYSYSLMSYILSESELLKIAESVK